MIVGRLRAPDIVEFELHFGGQLVKAVEERNLIRRTQRPTLGAGAVVPIDVDDERVVELTQILEGLDHPADLMVVVGGVGSEYLSLADEELLLVR